MATLLLAAPVGEALAAACDLDRNPPSLIRHDLTSNPTTSDSYCELCGYGYVTFIISNSFEDAWMTNVRVVENLGSSGLVYDPTAPNPITYRVNGGSAQAGAAPSGAGSVLTFNLPDVRPVSGSSPGTLEVRFAVRRTVDPEGLVNANRNISASLTFDTAPTDSSCNGFGSASDSDILPLREPLPSVTKLGRNVDAAQGGYSDPVYGNTNDDVVWRIEVRNAGPAALQDLRIDDVMGVGNFDINYACPTEGSALAVANNDGAAPGGSNCVAIVAGNSIPNFAVDNPFGSPGNDSPDNVDVPANSSAYLYLVGKVTSSCNNQTNTVSDVQWGCQVQAPDGGITATSSGSSVGSDSATMRTLVSNNSLQITRRVTGTNTSQPVGSKGTVTLIINNNSGGTVKNIKLRDLLPAGYVVDPTYPPRVDMDPAYGNYPGMTDNIVWTNPVAGTFPLTTTDPLVPLGNTAPEFELVSAGCAAGSACGSHDIHPDYPDQFNMMRHGDRLTITFRIVLINPAFYDRIADLDVRTEAPNSDPPGTDPNNTTTLDNELFVDFEQFCTPGVIQHPSSYPFRDDVAVDPEDLDVDIDSLVYILTSDPQQPLPLTVRLRNNGGHDAADATTYVSFGQAMTVQSAPAGCSPTSNPPSMPAWRFPATIPASASVYRCNVGTVGAGTTRNLTFNVIRNLGAVDDDLTFRADVIGEITLSNGTPLWFPAPIPRTDFPVGVVPVPPAIVDRANNYSLDGVRARVVGFDLRKSQVGNCSENNPPPGAPDDEVQIGEECTFHIDSGGWFGFRTPGFTYIAVQKIQVVDELPDGQGFISSTDPADSSTAAIKGIARNPSTLSPLDEGWFNWTFNQVVPAERISVKDEWFRVDLMTRLLNDPLNSRAPPNVHAAASTNIVSSTFQAVFENAATGLEETYDLGPATVGYPRVAVRRIDLTVTEPKILVTKAVCNETLYGTGPACSKFVPLANDGDAYNSYLYRITLTNEASSGGVARAPAYDVTATDLLDASDLAYVLPFATDGLDNDGDGATDEADEGTIGDNVVKNGVPATITFAHTHSAPLLRIDPGASVTFYYRVDFDDDAAPLQPFVNSVSATYDSLEGNFGHQSDPQTANGEAGGARVYTSESASATVRVIPVETRPKRVVALSNTPLDPDPEAIQAVSVGEEIRYELTTMLPVALLRSFVIRDELPPGLRCAQIPAINLSTDPDYAAAGFVPGGVPVSTTCDGNVVEWNFGDQRVTRGTVNNLFEFKVRFIARVENSALTNEGKVLSNGHPATFARTRYIDQEGETVELDFGQVDLVVREPVIVLSKSFAPAVNADAGDVLAVTVTATNTGTATAYNLQVLDDLVGSNLTATGSVGGTDPPDHVDTTTLGANRPIFRWNAPNGIAPGATVSFTFDVRADIAVQPHEVLNNTIQARWTSLPSRNTALNGSGAIGVDGSETGMRIGLVPNSDPADPVNDYETTAAASITVPAATLTKSDLNPELAPEVGAHKQFQIEILLPEGTTQGVVVKDNLAFGGVSYLLTDASPFQVSYEFVGIDTINGQTPGVAAFSEPAPAAGASGEVVWNIGTVVTRQEDDVVPPNTIAPAIRINYFARVNNDLDTNRGTALRNSALMNYLHGESGATLAVSDATEAITVTESSLSVEKTVTALTPPLTGGGVVEYVITLRNTGNATAYDLNLVDTLPPGVWLESSFTPTATLTVPPAAAEPVAGFVATPAGGPAGPLTWGRGNGDSSLDLPAGATLVVTYRARLQEVGVGTLVNRIDVDWTSLDGASGYERTGAGCPVITAPDDYCASDTVQIGSTDATRIDKSIVADTWIDPPGSAVDRIARVGDTITWRLALSLHEGTTRNVVVADALPAGLALVDFTLTPGSGNIAWHATAVPAPGQTGTLSWALGDIVNTPDGDTTNDTLVIEYRARVVTDTLAHEPSTALTNTVTLGYSDGSGTPVAFDPARMGGNATATVRQPVIATITKSDRTPRLNPAVVNVATDTMRFRVEACNATGQAPAYSVLITDQLATQFDRATLAGPTNGAGHPDVTINGAPAVEGTDYSYTPPATRGGTLTFRLVTPVDPGQCVTIDYDIGFHTDFGADETWENRATLDEYWSLPEAAGQRYGPVGPALFAMSNPATIALPTKALVSPASGEGTIGDEVVYRITVPGSAANAALNGVVVNDTLAPGLELIDVSEVSGNGLALNNTGSGSELVLEIGQIPAGAQAVIEVRARIGNSDATNAGDSFTNTAFYSHVVGGNTVHGGSATSAPVRIVEPAVSLDKAVVNVTRPGNPPRAGDILRYTLTFTASGGAAGDDFSDAFDLAIDDQLSVGLAYVAGTATVNGAGNTIADPQITGDGVTAGQRLAWDGANAQVNLPEGAVVQVTYDVRVESGVVANQVLSNSARAQWTSLAGAHAHERTGSATPAWNDYFTGPITRTLTVPDQTTFAKTRLGDTYGSADGVVRVGDVIDFELRLGLQEGTHTNVVVTDLLPQGLRFERVVSVDRFGAASTAAPNVSGDPALGPTTVTWNLGTLVNPADGDGTNDFVVIVYRARVVNEVLPQVDNLALTNSATLTYGTATGDATHSAGVTLDLRQPNLTVTKTAQTAGGDPALAAGEVVTYTVEITNTGTAPAYDALVTDTLPVGMRAAGVTLVGMALVNGGALPALAPAWDAATGVATWNLDTGVADAYTIPPGDTLRIVYRAQADGDVGAGSTLTNRAQVALYYSFDDEAVPAMEPVTGVREVYDPSEIASVTLTTPLPNALLKENTRASAAVGEPFTYRITVPSLPQETALHDVRIVDDLSLSAADLSFVSVAKVSGSQPWTPVNTGTAKNLVIEDTTRGIDIPAGEQVVVEVTVVLNDSAVNVSGLAFANTAAYTYDRVNGDPATQGDGGGSTTPEMTIVGPDEITLDKSGPAQMRLGEPATFTLDVQNRGTGHAWDLTVTDRLPEAPGAGMCDGAPVVLTAQIFAADGTTPVSPALVEGSDFTTRFAGAPACTFTITLHSAAAAIAPQQRLIVTYQAQVDADTLGGTTLTNVAGATEWFSADTTGGGATGQIRTYTRALTDGTPAVVDHEDVHALGSEAPVLVFQKSVFNVTTGQPGATARPGDRLRYSVVIRNAGTVPVSEFILRDELDRLNDTALFAPGTLALVTVPTGADTGSTNATGGAKGSGLVELRGLAIDAQGGANDELLVEFEATLAPAITSATVVLNQAQLLSIALEPPLSDDPAINGADDPMVVGDEDPTATVIASAPAFRVLKTSADLTGDTAELMAGDTLRYTLTVKNIGSENATGMTLRDAIPANTVYVPNSTRLNGVVVADPAPGVSPLQDGMAIHAPEDPTPGALRADAGATASNVATVTFDVRVDPSVMNGTVISNQGFVNGSGLGSGVVPETPSDDPDTTTPNDPTRDVVGNLPLVDAQKTVQIAGDAGTPGIVDPGDVLRYTITLINSGATPATGVTLIDQVPANTTYVADSVRLNGLPMGQPDGGVSPLAAGIAVNSSDLTPPVPVGTNGTLSGGGTATVTFDVVVNAGVAAGTVIRNQGSVTTNELPAEPTDADGNDANGDQPTDVVVGNAQLLTITKEVAVVGGGAARAGGQLEYTVRVANPATLPATLVVITDDLAPLAGQATYVSDSATLDGSSVGVSVAASVITADYSTTRGSLAPGATTVLRFRVQIEPALPMGTTLTNTAVVSWDSPTRSASATASIDIGGTPGSAAVNGRVWHDGNLNRAFEDRELKQANWSVDVYRNGQMLGSATTDSDGRYRISGLAPDLYELRFRAPGAGPDTAMLGRADSAYTNGPQRISAIAAGSGSNLLDLNLPLQPNGVVYDAVLRTPIVGATLTMVQAATGMPLPESCFDDPAQQDQVTLAQGYYKFDLNFSQPSCTAPGDYVIRVTPPASGYVARTSRIIPPMSSEETSAFSVPDCAGGANDAVPATAGLCEVQPSEFAPALGVAPRTAATHHYLKLALDDDAVPGDSQPFNNHIPVDPRLDDVVTITKTAGLVNVSRGGLVPYTITVKNTLGVTLEDLTIVDTFPAGFKYVKGSARIDGVAVEPEWEGRQLTWSSPDLETDAQHTVTLLLVVGSGVSEGDYVNRAQVFNPLTGSAVSGEATATVRVVPDATFDCTDIIGKVFDDANLNGRQDEGEPGLAGVRIVSARGLIMTTDEHGRYHLTCAVVPDEDRGSNFILKLDDRSLPSGYRVVTENPLVQRATRGKMIKFNFGAALHRVVSLGIADGVFAPDSTDLRVQWQPRIETLLEELTKAPPILRISYLADVESASLVERRVAAVKRTIADRWREMDCCGPLTIETEIFWRRGGPPD